MPLLLNILYFLITIFIIVLVHEFGHFAAAKISKMRVDRFSIGFPPRAFGKKIGDTDYCVSWVPIGGYVKIAGMIDESFDTEYLKNEPQPWEFRSKPLYQKVFVITAGVLMNVILAFAIFWGIAFFQKQIIWKTTEIGIVQKESLAEKIGFKENDKILSINGKAVENWNQIEGTIFLEQMSDNVNVDIERAGVKETLDIPKNSIKETDLAFFLNPKYVIPKIAYVEPNSPASRAGLLENDLIVSVKEMPVTMGSEVTTLIHSSAGIEIPIKVKRNNQINEIKVTPDPNTKIIGIRIQTEYFGEKEEVSLGIFQAFVTGINTSINNTYLFLKSLWQIITGKVEFSRAVGGPVKIAKFATQSAELGLVPFLSFIAILSLTLAIINILPFPALDGGHLVFILYEGIFKKEIPVKVKLVIQQIGFGVLLLFMVFVIYNDIFK